MRIYLDMCCYNRPYDPQDQLKVAMEAQSKILIQRYVEEGKFGVVGAEAFVALILREKLDYTKWRRTHYDEMRPGEFHEKALEYAKDHPYSGNAQVI